LGELECEVALVGAQYVGGTLVGALGCRAARGTPKVYTGSEPPGYSWALSNRAT
jgi:hypothetical protein